MNERIDVLLLAPHRHLGEPKKSGDVINVTIEQSDWLIARGIARIYQLTKKEVKS